LRLHVLPMVHLEPASPVRPVMPQLRPVTTSPRALGMQLSMLVLLMQIVMVYALIREKHVEPMRTVLSVGVLLQDRPVPPFTRV
jgi:uncharacterized membrane protein